MAVARRKKAVLLRYGESVEQQTLNFEKEFARFGKESLCLRAWIEQKGNVLSHTSVLFTAPRFMELARCAIGPLIRKISGTRFELSFTSRCFQHQVSFHLDGIGYRAEDNFFDLFPSVPHTVQIALDKPCTVASLRKALQLTSYVDSYEG
jgi:beta-mannosidase